MEIWEKIGFKKKQKYEDLNGRFGIGNLMGMWKTYGRWRFEGDEKAMGRESKRERESVKYKEKWYEILWEQQIWRGDIWESLKIFSQLQLLVYIIDFTINTTYIDNNIYATTKSYIQNYGE